MLDVNVAKTPALIAHVEFVDQTYTVLRRLALSGGADELALSMGALCRRVHRGAPSIGWIRLCRGDGPTSSTTATGEVDFATQ